MIDIDGRRYREDELITFITGRPYAPAVFLARDGSGVFVQRRERGQLRVYRADAEGIDALAEGLNLPQLRAALPGRSIADEAGYHRAG